VWSVEQTKWQSPKCIGNRADSSVQRGARLLSSRRSRSHLTTQATEIVRRAYFTHGVSTNDDAAPWCMWTYEIFASWKHTERPRPAPPRSLSVTRSRAQQNIHILYTQIFTIYFFRCTLCVQECAQLGCQGDPWTNTPCTLFHLLWRQWVGSLSAERLNSQFTDGSLSLTPRNKSTGLTRATLQIRWASCTQKGCRWQGHKQTLHHHIVATLTSNSANISQYRFSTYYFISGYS
jgi:hypothetical protein